MRRRGYGHDGLGDVRVQALRGSGMAFNGRTERAAVAAVMAALLAVLLLQLDAISYLRGDGDYYLRDALTFARGEVPRSRYSPGFPLLLAPLVWLAGGDAANAGRAALVLTATAGALSFGLLQRFLRVYLGPAIALGVVSVAALSQGPVVYFADIRPEAVALLLVVATLLALQRGASGWAVALAGFVVLVRVALAPFVVVLWLVWSRRAPRAALAGILVALAAVVAHVATEPVVDQGYVQIGGAIYDAEAGGGSRLRGLLAVAAGGTLSYLRYGLPRFVWPFAALDSPLGPLLAAATLAVLVAGLVSLVRHVRPESNDDSATRARAVLLAAIAAFVVELAALLLWPIRELAAIRLVLPLAAVPLLGLGAGLRLLAGRVAPRHGERLAAVALVTAVAVSLASTALIVQARSVESRPLADFREAHLAARGELPPGPVLSPKPAATELLTARPAFGYALGGDIHGLAARVRACTLVVDLGSGQRRDVRRLMHEDVRTLAVRGETAILLVNGSWCWTEAQA